jgi:hypothetical protein
MPGLWPDEALTEQAGSIGLALLELIDAEVHWVHRRVEQIQLLSATQLTRSVATDLTVPTALAASLGLQTSEDARDTTVPTRFVLPLGVLPKGPLQDLTITPPDAYRLTADQTNRLMVAAMAPYVRESGVALPEKVLSTARAIIRSETSSPALLRLFKRLVGDGDGSDNDARRRLKRLVETLNDAYVLLVVVKADPGMPLRITYSHRQFVEAEVGAMSEPPLTIETLLNYASGPGPPYRVEVVAPDGLEVEAASMVDGETRVPIAWQNTDPGDGAFVQLRAPDGVGRPRHVYLKVVFGWPGGGVHQISSIAGLVSTCALLTATLASYWLNDKMKGSSAGTLLAAPALVTSLALGFATTRVTSKAANRLRVAALWVALFGVVGALAVSLLGENKERLNALHGLLIACTALSALVTSAFAGRAAMRRRAQIEPADAA